MKMAHRLGLTFDLDGVSSAGTAQFLSGFGGTLQSRIRVSRARPVYAMAQHLARLAGLVNGSTFT